MIRKATALAFPIRPRPIKSNVAERSWRLIEYRRPFRKIVLGRQSKLCNSWLRACFAGWRGLRRAARTARREVSDIFFHTAAAAHMLETTGHVLRAMLGSNRVSKRRNTQAELRVAADRGDSAGVYRAVRKLGPGKPKPPLKLLSADEKQLLDPIQIATRLHEHIAFLHDGKTVTREELMKHVHDTVEAYRHVPDAHLSPWKTFGEDCFTSPPTQNPQCTTGYSSNARCGLKDRCNIEGVIWLFLEEKRHQPHMCEYARDRFGTSSCKMFALAEQKLFARIPQNSVLRYPVWRHLQKRHRHGFTQCENGTIYLSAMANFSCFCVCGCGLSLSYGSARVNGV